MPPPPRPLPPPRTEAARTALKSFYCELCQKGYARLPEWEAHEASYDHQHKKRLKEMKAMSRDPAAAQRARKAERKADEKGGAALISIKPMKLGTSAGNATAKAPQGAAGSGFKKGGFKSAFGGQGKVKVEGQQEDEEGEGGEAMDVREDGRERESDSDGEYERYDPSNPTDCPDDCPGRLVS
jgi:hypothetical protein